MEKAEIVRSVEVDYDPKGDVLYISFEKPQEADDSDITEEGMIIRLKRGKDCWLGYSERQQKDAPETAQKLRFISCMVILYPAAFCFFYCVEVGVVGQNPCLVCYGGCGYDAVAHGRVFVLAFEQSGLFGYCWV